MKKLGVLGGGAAGYFGAIQLATLTRGRATVTLIEKGSVPLTKVRVSGGGRCNVTHSLFDPKLLSERYPRGSKELRAAFERFQPRDTVEQFERWGVSLKTESDGRMFPTTDDSATIIDCLEREAERAGVQVRLSTPVRALYVDPERREGKFELALQEGASLFFDQLLIATGSSRPVWAWCEALGHTIEKPVPSLFTINLLEEKIKALPGISVPNAEIRLLPKGKPQSGPILITHWGLSGPAVLKLSAWEASAFAECDYKTQVRVNWTGTLSGEEFLAALNALKQESPAKKISSHPQFGFAGRLWEYFLEKAMIPDEKRWADVSNTELQRLREAVCGAVYEVNGKGVFKDEFVTCGGIRRKEIDFKTMESKVISGLYFAGEALDIDGITGGFNFQNAWTTSWIAAQGMSRK